MNLQGYPRSLILAPIESMYGTSYWSSRVILVQRCRVSEIYWSYRTPKATSFRTPPLFRPKFLARSTCNRSVMLGSTERERRTALNYFRRIPTMWSR